METFKKGDYVNYIFGQPGNDTTQLLVLDVGEKLRCWDIWFDFEIEVSPDRVCLMKDERLGGKVRHHKYGTISYRDRFKQVEKEKFSNDQVNRPEKAKEKNNAKH